MANFSQLVSAWLNAPSASPDTATIEAIFRVLENKSYHEEYLVQLCNLLFTFYRSSEDSKKKFAIAFVPLLIELHLRFLKNGRESRHKSIDVILLGIYNLEVVDEDGNSIERKFRIPTLSKPSVFHEASTNMQTQSALTENSLHKLDTGSDCVVSSFGPYMEYEQINAASRMTVLMVLMKVSNECLSSLPKESLRRVCRACVKIIPSASHCNPCDSKLPTDPLDFSSLISKVIPQISLSEDFLVELTYSVYFCLYNDIVIEGRKALEKLHSHALGHLYPSVLLVSTFRGSVRAFINCSPSLDDECD